MARRLFVDLDGTLVDFEKGVHDVFGVPIDRVPEARMWAVLNRTPDFYANLPWLPDGKQLWDYCVDFEPTILTGCPKSFTDRAALDKKIWCARELGPDVPVTTTLSALKYESCHPGDVLVDDMTKYADKWIQAGGIFVHHTSAADSIVQLAELGFVI